TSGPCFAAVPSLRRRGRATRRRAILGQTALARHPCRAHPTTTPPLSLPTRVWRRLSDLRTVKREIKSVGDSRCAVLSAGFLPHDINRHQYRAGQHEAARPGQGDQVAGETDADPHQADCVDLALERDAIAFEIIADPRAESFVVDQPVIKARRAAGEAGG